MVTPQEEAYVLNEAYVPEHVIPLMAGLSQAEPFFQDDYLFFLKEDGVIFVGYPLGADFREETFSAALVRCKRSFNPPPFGSSPRRFRRICSPEFKKGKEMNITGSTSGNGKPRGACKGKWKKHPSL